MSRQSLRIATRGSTLARRQAESVREELQRRRTEASLVEVSTRGDEIRDELIHRLGRTGAFVRSLDEKILSGEVDAAVHSMKDMPTEMPEELVVAGVPERAPSGDVLVTPDGRSIGELPANATVGTSSFRRTAQLLAAREDLSVEPLRGNVDTRLEKLLAPSLQREHERRLDAESDGDGDATSDGEGNAESGGKGNDDRFDRSVDEWFDSLSELERSALGRAVDTEYDAIVLAEAGLRRSGLYETVPTDRLDRTAFVPAPGQGAIAVTATDPDVVELIYDAIDHPPTRIGTTVERTILAELGGGCIAPIGVDATLRGEFVRARVQVLSLDGTERIETTRDLPATDYATAAVEFAEGLRTEGAAELIDRATDEIDEGDGDE